MGAGRGATASTAAAAWQTPGTDSFRSRGGDRKDEMGLDQQARAGWPTPQAAEAKQVKANKRGNPSLTTAAGGGTETPKRLNPRFVEWLMGFPLGWTSFEHSGTEWSRWWQRMRSVLSRLE